MNSSQIQNLVDALPTRKGAGFRRWGGGRVHIPDGEHDLTEQIIVPNETNVELFCDSRTSAKLNNATGQPDLFVVQSTRGVGHEFTLKNLCLDSGGVLVEGKRRGNTVLDNCKIIKSPKAGLYMKGSEDRNLGPANWSLINTDFIECERSVHASVRSHSLGFIQGGRSIASKNTPFYLDLIGLQIYTHDFAGSGGKAFIQYGGGAESSSHHIVQGCRFSSEDVVAESGEVPTPPVDILLGDEGAASSRHSSVIRFRDNLHAGARPDDVGGEHAFLFTNQARSIIIEGSRFSKNYKSHYIQQDSYKEPTDCFFVSNFVQGNGLPVFNKNEWV